MCTHIRLAMKAAMAKPYTAFFLFFLFPPKSHCHDRTMPIPRNQSPGFRIIFMIKNKKTLNFIGITTISLILATIGGACTPDTSEDEDDYELTCTGNECRIANRVLSCSQDGQFVYEYYDPQLPHLYGIQDDTDYACGLSSNMAIYYLDLTKVNEGTSFKYIYECDTDDNYQCRIIDNSIGCYRLCGTQGENAKTWCEQYRDTSHHLFRTIPSQNECVFNSIDGKYYSNTKIEKLFCPSDRPYDNTTGCSNIIEEDGRYCWFNNERASSECIERNGQFYRLNCNNHYPETDILLSEAPNDYYYTAALCDVCEKVNYPYEEARCLEKCSAAGEVKYTCDDYISIKWSCKAQANGNTYWSTETSERCYRGCADNGKCIKYEGEGEQCSPSQYHSKCVDKDTLMNCPVETKKATASSCSGMGLFLDYILSFSDNQSGDRNLICLETKDGAECVTEKNPNPCTKEGQKVTR